MKLKLITLCKTGNSYAPHFSHAQTSYSGSPLTWACFFFLLGFQGGGGVHLELFNVQSGRNFNQKFHVPPRQHELYCEDISFSISNCVFCGTTSCKGIVTKELL